MNNNKILINTVLLILIISCISVTSAEDNEYNHTDIIIIESENQNDCNLCKLEMSIEPSDGKKIVPHSIPVAKIILETGNACVGDEFNPNCDDENNDDPDPWMIPPLSQESETDMTQKTCNLCGSKTNEKILASEQEEISEKGLINTIYSKNTVDKTDEGETLPSDSTSSNKISEDKQLNTDDNVIEGEPMESEPVDADPVQINEGNPCWYQPDDGAIIEFYPPEEVYVDNVGMGCGETASTTISVRWDPYDPDDGFKHGQHTIVIPYHTMTINSFDVPLYSCNGETAICGVATANGIPSDESTLPKIEISFYITEDGTVSLGVIDGPELKQKENDPPEIQANENINFEFKSSDSLNSQSGNLIFEWSFGDGNKKIEGKTSQHAYKNPGIYDIVLKVKNEKNEIVDRGVKTIEVIEEKQKDEKTEEIEGPIDENKNVNDSDERKEGEYTDDNTQEKNNDEKNDNTTEYKEDKQDEEKNNEPNTETDSFIKKILEIIKNLLKPLFIST